MEQVKNAITENTRSHEEKVKEITIKLEQGIKELFESCKYKEYLDVMSRFHTYSVSNSMLIAMQKPDATRIASYTSWNENFERHVKKGEKGIRILAPSPYKTNRVVDKIDNETGHPVTDEHGEPLKEQIQTMVPAYKVVTVFDISQTEGKELPRIANELNYDIENYTRFMEALKGCSPVPVEERPIEGNAHGYYRLDDRKIIIKEGMGQTQTLKTCIHEIAHAILHDKETGTVKDSLPDRFTREVQAESVAYTVCNHFGVDTSDYSFGYIAGWSTDKNLDELKKSMNIIRKTSSGIICTIEKALIREDELSNAEEKVRNNIESAISTHNPIKIDDSKLRVHGRHR